jgi:hypothetical protein
MSMETNQYTFVFTLLENGFVPLEYTTEMASDVLAIQLGQRLVHQYAKMTFKKTSVFIARISNTPKEMGVWEAFPELIVHIKSKD